MRSTTDQSKEAAALSKACPSSTVDRALVSRIQSGEVRAEEVFARRFHARLIAMARMRGCGEQAADLVQETLAIGLGNLRRGDWKGDGSIMAYLATILRRNATRFRVMPHVTGSQSQIDRLPASGPDPLTTAEAIEIRERLAEALERLPPRHREILLLYYLSDQSASELGRWLRIPRGTVLSRLHYARKRVSELLRSGPYP